MAYPNKEKRNKEIIEKHFKGWSLREIGSFYNLHHSTVDELIKKWAPVYKKPVSGVVDN